MTNHLLVTLVTWSIALPVTLTIIATVVVEIIHRLYRQHVEATSAIHRWIAALGGLFTSAGIVATTLTALVQHVPAPPATVFIVLGIMTVTGLLYAGIHRAVATDQPTTVSISAPQEVTL